MKNIYFSCAFLMSSFSFAQVGINTINPIQTFHVDGGKDNPSSGTPTTAEALNDVTIDSSGNLGIGTVTPAAKLDVNGNTIIRGLYTSEAGNNVRAVVVSSDNILKTGNLWDIIFGRQSQNENNPLVKKLNEQDAEISELKNEIAELKAQIQELLNR